MHYIFTFVRFYCFYHSKSLLFHKQPTEKGFLNLSIKRLSLFDVFLYAHPERFQCLMWLDYVKNFNLVKRLLLVELFQPIIASNI